MPTTIIISEPLVVEETRKVFSVQCCRCCCFFLVVCKGDHFALSHGVGTLLTSMTFYEDHCDRHGHINRNVFNCYAMISSLAKVMGLQSPFFLAHLGENGRSKNMLLWVEITFSTTAVIILVVQLIIFLDGSL